MTCEEFLNTISSIDPEDCTRGERSAVMDHAGSCANCFAFVERELDEATGTSLAPDEIAEQMAIHNQDLLDPEYMEGRRATP